MLVDHWYDQYVRPYLKSLMILMFRKNNKKYWRILKINCIWLIYLQKFASRIFQQINICFDFKKYIRYWLKLNFDIALNLFLNVKIFYLQKNCKIHIFQTNSPNLMKNIFLQSEEFKNWYSPITFIKYIFIRIAKIFNGDAFANFDWI